LASSPTRNENPHFPPSLYRSDSLDGPSTTNRLSSSPREGSPGSPKPLGLRIDIPDTSGTLQRRVGPPVKQTKAIPLHPPPSPPLRAVGLKPRRRPRKERETRDEYDFEFDSADDERERGRQPTRVGVRVSGDERERDGESLGRDELKVCLYATSGLFGLIIYHSYSRHP
jgi:hypothetical protein